MVLTREKREPVYRRLYPLFVLLSAAPSYLFNKLKIEAFLLAIAGIGPGLGGGQGHSAPWDDRRGMYC